MPGFLSVDIARVRHRSRRRSQRPAVVLNDRPSVAARTVLARRQQSNQSRFGFVRCGRVLSPTNLTQALRKRHLNRARPARRKSCRHPVRVGAFGGKGRCGAVSANVDDHEHVVGVDQGPVVILGPKAAFARCQELLERAICHAEYFQRRQLQPAQRCHNRRRRRLTRGALLRTSDASFVASDAHPSLAERRELVMSGGTRWYVWRRKGVERGGAAILK